MPLYSLPIHPVDIFEGLGLAQVPAVPFVYSSSPALWSQLLTALVVGLLTAFGLQVLLTNLGIALGISVLSRRFSLANRTSENLLPNEANTSEADTNEADTNEADTNEAEENTDRNPPNTGWIGAGILLVMNVVLFSACFLAAKFTHTTEPVSGAIVGITIWSAYLLILIWVSTRTLNSVAGFLFDRATGGLRQIISTITAAFQHDEIDSIPVTELPTLIQQEVRTALNSAEMHHFIETQLQTVIEGTIAAQPYPSIDYEIADIEEEATSLPEHPIEQPQLWHPIQTYLTETSSKKLSPKALERKLPTLLQAIQEQLPDDRPVPPLPLEELADQLHQRQDLSDKKKQRILQQIESRWAELAADRPATTGSTATDTTAADSMPVESTETEQVSPEGSNSGSSVLSSEALQVVVENAIRYTVAHLPDTLQESKLAVPYAVGSALVGLAATLDDLKDANALPESLSLDITELKPYLNRLVQAAPATLSDLGQSSLQQAGQIRDLALKPIESIQQGVQSQVDRLQQRARERAEAARRAAARATWWLFTIVTTSALSAALAGAFASGLTLQGWWME